MGDVMETEEAVDYSDDLHLEQVIFKCHNFISTKVGPSRPSISPPHTSSVVSLVDHRPSQFAAGNSPHEPPTLDPHHVTWDPALLSTAIPPSSSFDLLPHNTTFFAATSAGPPTSVAATPSVSLHSSSRCFETPAVRVRYAKSTHLEGSLDPLVDHPSTPRTEKKKTRCVKATTRDISI